RRPRQRSALNRAPFLLRCRFPHVANKTCSLVRHSVFSRAGRHSSDRSNLVAKRVAFARAKLPPQRVAVEQSSCYLQDQRAREVDHRSVILPGPHNARPGLAPVCSPSLSTWTPLTKTCFTPVAY